MRQYWAVLCGVAMLVPALSMAQMPAPSSCEATLEVERQTLYVARQEHQALQQAMAQALLRERNAVRDAEQGRQRLATLQDELRRLQAAPAPEMPSHETKE